MRNSLKNIQERQQKILKYINQCGHAEVEELSEKFHVSSVTVRRDLDSLAKNGQITRNFGGARSLTADSTSHFASPVITSQEATRRALAKAAASMIENDDIVLINSSLTASYVLEYLDNKQVTIVTNNISTLIRKRGANTTLIITGGQASDGHASLTGPYTTNALSNIVANKCILGVRGIHATEGITSQILEESYINQLMIRQTNGNVIVVADSSKIGKKNSFFSGDIHSIDTLITSSEAKQQDLEELYNAGVQIEIVPT